MRLKGLARGLTRERADKGTQAMIDQVVARPASTPACLSSPPAWCSSFGHDTPALLERRMPARMLVDWNWAALSAAPNAINTDRAKWPWRWDDLRYNFRNVHRSIFVTVVIREPLRRERNDQGSET